MDSRQQYLIDMIGHGYLSVKKEDFCAFICDAAKVDEHGREITEDGVHHPWPCVCYRKLIDNSLIGELEYQQLGPFKHCYKVKFLDTELMYMATDRKLYWDRQRLYEDEDCLVINALYTHLMKNDDLLPMMVAHATNGFVKHSEDVEPMLSSQPTAAKPCPKCGYSGK